MADELLPCPLCNGPAEIWKAHENRKAWIACVDRCLVLTKEHDTNEQAIAHWNTRQHASAAIPEGYVLVKMTEKEHREWKDAWMEKNSPAIM